MLRSYTTTFDEPGLPIVAQVTSIPAATLGEPGALQRWSESLVGGAWRPLPSDEPTAEDGSLAALRSLVGALVLGSTGQPRFEAYDVADLVGSWAYQRLDLALDQAHSRLVDHVVTTPVIAVENSWPTMQSVSSLVLAGGGGVILGMALGPLGAVLGTVGGLFGGLLVQVAKPAAEAYGAEVGSAAGRRHARRLDDPLLEAGRRRDRHLADLDAALRSKRITQKVHDELVADVWRRSFDLGV